MQSLKAVVQTLKHTSGSGGSGPGSEEAERLLEEERAKVREAQLHVSGLTKSFDALLVEMERMKAASPRADAVRSPELLRPPSAAGGEPSTAVAVARVVLQGYSAAQAESALRQLGRNDAPAAVEYLRSLGANPEVDPPTAARLGGASRPYSPYPVAEVVFPKGRPPMAAGAAAWPGQVKARPWRGDIFTARRRACTMLVQLTSRAYAMDSPDARDMTMASLTAQKVLVNREVPCRLLLQAGTLEACSAVLAVYRRDPEVVCAAAAVLRELTANPKSMAAARSNPKTSATMLAAVAAMKSNPSHLACLIHCSGLLWGLVSLCGPQLQALAVESDAPYYLMQALDTYPESRELAWRATGALLATALHNPETQQALLDQGAHVAIRAALAADPTLQYGGEFSPLRGWLKSAAPVQQHGGIMDPQLQDPRVRMRDANPRGRPYTRRNAPMGATTLATQSGVSVGASSAVDSEATAATEEAHHFIDDELGYVGVQTRSDGYVRPLMREDGTISHAQLMSATTRGEQGGVLPRRAGGRAWDADQPPSRYAPLAVDNALPLSPYPQRPATAWESEVEDSTWERSLQQQRARARLAQPLPSEVLQGATETSQAPQRRSALRRASAGTPEGDVADVRDDGRSDVSLGPPPPSASHQRREAQMADEAALLARQRQARLEAQQQRDADEADAVERARRDAAAEEADFRRAQQQRRAQQAAAQEAAARQAEREAALQEPVREAPPQQQQQAYSAVSVNANLSKALAALAAPSATPEALSSALRVVTKECGVGNAAEVVASGGLPLVVDALAAHPDAPAVCADACLVLGMVTQESEAAAAARASLPAQDGSAVAAVAAALNAHPGVMALQATGAWALWGLARGSPVCARRAAAAGAPAQLVNALNMHASSPEVAQSAAGALLAIAATGAPGQAAVAAAGGVAAVKKAMKQHASITFRGEFDGLREWLRSGGGSK